MKAREYEVLDRAVMEGVEYGLTRAHKYTDTPTRHHLVDEVHKAVMSGICEWFEFDPAPAELDLPPVKSYCGGVPNYCVPVDLSDGGHHD